MLPKLIYHVQSSLDGRIDWIKPDGFLYYRVIANQTYDAMISGSNTILAAPLSPEVKIKKILSQYLIVVDSRGRIHNWEIIKRQPHWNDTPIVFCSQATPTAYRRELKGQNVHCVVAGKDKVDLRAALGEAADRFGIITIRIDSGGTLAGALLRESLVDELSLLLAPQLTGGSSPKTVFAADDLTSLDGVIDLEYLESRIVESGHLWLRYRVLKKTGVG